VRKRLSSQKEGAGWRLNKTSEMWTEERYQLCSC
jgi:hypothetical protein